MPGSILGTSVRRVEDRDLLTGASTFVGNLQLPDVAHLVFVRSPFAHAVITGIDTSAAAAAPGVLGVQCQLWTEYMPTPEQVEYMAFPRLCAFAEVAWGSSGDYADFLRRLDPHLARHAAQGVRVGALFP